LAGAFVDDVVVDYGVHWDSNPSTTTLSTRDRELACSSPYSRRTPRSK
jgi:hypothetical protein